METMFPFLLLLPGVAMGCSCPLGERPNQEETIKSDFCRRGAGVFSAVVMGATCNCVPSTANNTYHCEDLTLNPSGVGVTEETINRAVCANVDFVQRSYTVLPCSQTIQRLARGNEVVDVTQSLPPVQNVTIGRYCKLTCPFNNATSTSEVYNMPDINQPCVYTLRITEVFQGNFTMNSNLISSGPLVLTSCGFAGRLLQLGEEYLVGIGQPASCTAFSEWSTLSSYTDSNIQYLRDLRTGYQRFGPMVCSEAPTCSGMVCSGASTCAAISWLALGIVLYLVCGSDFTFP